MVMEPSTTVEAMSQDTEGVFCPKRLDPHTGSYNYENVPCINVVLAPQGSAI